MDIVSLKDIEMEKELGVWIDKDLKWSQRCKRSSSKAMSVLGMMKRSLNEIDIDRYSVQCTVQCKTHNKFVARANAQTKE